MPSPLNSNETVLAIDPGNFATAYCLLRGDRKIIAFNKVENSVFLEWLRNAMRLEVRPSIVACEMIASYGLSVGASVFETAVFIGECKSEVSGYAPWVQVVRLEVKLAICRSPKANDATIRAALLDLYGAPGTKKSPGPTYGITKDVWAALALAETVRSGEYRPYVPVHERDTSVKA